MAVQIFECDRCQKRSRNEEENKNWVCVQWDSFGRDVQHWHLCPACAKIMAETFLSPRHMKAKESLELSFFTGETADNILYAQYKDNMNALVPGSNV